jgi:hypothetical protein
MIAANTQSGSLLNSKILAPGAHWLILTLMLVAKSRKPLFFDKIQR